MHQPEEEHAEQNDECLKKDTMDKGFTTEELMDPPGEGVSQEERMDFIHQQLGGFGRRHVAFHGLVFLGSGDRDRVQGGISLCKLFSLRLLKLSTFQAAVCSLTDCSVR